MDIEAEVLAAAVARDRALVADDAAAVARKASSGRWDGAEYVADEWISDIFVRQDGRWLCALSHTCPAE